tara:strand:+ start:520 stop:1791 length:1272 start_codon:yes stop_codon:yes gene_type:complete
MSNYTSCVNELAPRLKKRGMENPDGMAASMCAVRFADDEETPRQFSVDQTLDEKRRAFAMDMTLSADAFPEQFNEEKNIWEFPVLAITSGEHKYTEDGSEEKVYIEPSILKSNIESFTELPIYVNHQRTQDDLIGTAINPEIKEMDDGKIAVGMLAQVSNSERGKEIIKKMQDGDVTNVSIDWFSKDIDVMGDTFATSIRPVEVSFIDNVVADPVCDECTIETKCDSQEEVQVEQEEPCCDSCSSGDTTCGQNPEDGTVSEDDTMSEEVVKSEAEVITEREFASIKTQLDEMTSNYKDLQGKYESATKAISDFEEMEAKRANEAAALRKKELVNAIIDRQVVLKTLEEEKKEVRFEELKDWDEVKLSGFNAALEAVPVPEETERSFGKGKAHEASEAPVETEVPERERMFSMDKNGRIVFNKK